MRPFWLASSSPRRKLLLEAAGFEPTCVGCQLDDDLLRVNEQGVLGICAARAWFKAFGVHSSLESTAEQQSGSRGVLLAADTLCELNGSVLGKPANQQEAKRMLKSLIGASHRTITGVALLDRDTMVRSIWCDVADVSIDQVDEQLLDTYLASEQWRGKSGGYNLADRMDDGWSICCSGDPATVMGLPIRRLQPEINRMLNGN